MAQSQYKEASMKARVEQEVAGMGSILGEPAECL